MITDKDKAQIAERGLSEEEVESQLERFQNGFPSIEIVSPALCGDGIIRLEKGEQDFFVAKYDESDIEVTKFVPASGAASRMFKSLFAFISDFDGTDESLSTLKRNDKTVEQFFDRIESFAFYQELESVVKTRLGKSIEELKDNMLHTEIAKYLLTSDGMNYGNMPKGLLPFHSYKDEKRTPAQEYLFEGLMYASKNEQVNLHFTVSPEHQQDFSSHVAATIKNIKQSAKINVTYSVQQLKTDTIASTLTYEPFRNSDGALLFRPAGHGALLENLNCLDSDLIFIKNIDNVVPDNKKSDTVRFKKALAGVLITHQKDVFDLLVRNDSGEDVLEEGANILRRMGIRNFRDEEIIALLNRPMRVCGMVKNEGEPGGGPFWVNHENKESLQIVESAQVDSTDEGQTEIFKKGTHFNPVDIVCGVKNYKGKKFDLIKYRDDEAGFISKKSSDGQSLLAMELPGLWNGGMANWNTIFVEVPLITFNPVKTVTDLLKPNHI